MSFDRPFLDVQSIQRDQDWNAALGHALGHCRTRLALYTPDYFGSDFCGREWKAFEDRQRSHRELDGVDAKALIPVLWEPVQSIPAGAAHIPYGNLEFGEKYAQWGLRRILVADPGGEEYRRIVNLLARQILVAAEHFPIPAAEGLDITAPQSAGPFPSAAQRAEPGSHALLPVAARTSGTAHHQRSTDPGCHGESPTDWNPYRTQFPEPVARTLDEARGQGQVAVLLVEARAAADEPSGRALRAYDRSNHPGSAAIVPCGPDEAGDGPRSKPYGEAVRSVLPLNWAKTAGDPLPLLQSGIVPDEFDGALHAVVAKVQNHLFSFLETIKLDSLERSRITSTSLPVLTTAAVTRPEQNCLARPQPARPSSDPLPLEQEQDR